MKLISRWVLGFLVLLFLFPSNVRAEEVRYIEKLSDQDAAVVISGQESQVSVGDLIPGCGTVIQITDTHLIVEQRLSDAEKEDLERQGAAVYDALQTRIPRQDLRFGFGSQTIPKD